MTVVKQYIPLLLLWFALGYTSVHAFDTQFFSYSQRIALVKKYIDANAGHAALTSLRPLMYGTPRYPIMILAAQAYAELDRPADALYYYTVAKRLSTSPEESQIAAQGIVKMRRWMQVRFTSSITRIPRLASVQYRALSKKKYFASRKIDSNQAYLLAAQAYAEKNNPQLALMQYRLALEHANNVYERTAALFGIGKMQLWLGHYYHAMSSYRDLLTMPMSLHDRELANAGLVKSEAYADRPILAYHSIPGCKFTTPEMTIAAAQATLWADQPDLSLQVLTQNRSIIQKINPNSSLGRDLKDLEWQVALNTHPNVLTPSAFYSKDSEDFSVFRSTLDYSRYWSYTYESFVGLEHIRYGQYASRLNAEGVYFRQKWRPTRTLTVDGKIEPTTYDQWNPLLWAAYANYRPNDYFGARLFTSNEVIQTFPGFDNHLAGAQYAADIFLSPIPYLRVNGSASTLNITDGNVRNGYFISATTILSTTMGVNLTLQSRGYTDKFVSPNYFSPNQYNTNIAILRFSSRFRSVWHYYVDGGLGIQSIGITGSPTTTSPTRQFGIGLNGPINRYLVLNACYAISRQVSAFLGSPDYKYQYGVISLNILL